MHKSSYSIITRFRDLVDKNFKNEKIRVLDVGSYGVNGTYKEIFSDPQKYDYVGLDVNPGPNVDYVPADSYSWPELKDEAFEVIISGQAFEHIEFPWLVIDEMKRTLKKNGLICIVAPSRGPEHKYPVDCWRYYPDGFRALAKWAGLEVLESKTYWGTSGFSDGSDQWGDSFCILYKNESEIMTPQSRRNIVSPRILQTNIVNRNNPLHQSRLEEYYGHAREDVVSTLIRHGIQPKKVLEIGCASGATGRRIRELLRVEYYAGVELSEAAAIIAREHLDQVFVADIENTDLTSLGLQRGAFDLLLVLDVLEHLYDPWNTLSVLTQYVKPDGYIVASLPNVQNIAVVNDLLKGRWQYSSAGILDATHLRFFTLESIIPLFSGAGISLERTDSVLFPGINVAKLKESDNKILQDNISISHLSKSDMIRFFTYQYIVVGKKDNLQGSTREVELGMEGLMSLSDVYNLGRAEFQPDLSPEAISMITVFSTPVTMGMTSIIILTFNQLEYTRECVESIRKHTPEPHEIIFVDNGSSDGTVKWLRKLAHNNPKVKLIENKENLGFSKGCNQGMEASGGEYIVLLNNDVVVTENWLSGMLACLNSAPDIGIVGPMTNNISGIQKVPQVEYEALKDLPQYAAAFGEKYRHRRIASRRIVGFCMLFRREMAEKIGLLDESFGSGNFEDDDYCYRAALDGYRNAIAGDVFIHHYGSRSFIGNKINYGESISGNRKIFNEKWSGIDVSTPLGQRVIVLNAVERAWKFHERGEHEKSVEVLIDAIKYSPDAAEIYYCLAEIFLENHKYPEALEALQSLPDTAKEAERTLTLMGYALEGLERCAEADEHADRAIAMQSCSAKALNLKGIIFYRQGDVDTAETFFCKASEMDSGYGETYTNIGVLTWAAGNKDESLTLLEKAFILSPGVPDVGTVYYSAVTELEQFASAEKLLADAKALHPDNRQISFWLIDSLLKQGRYMEAMREIEQAMITFGISDGILNAALDVRAKLGPMEPMKTTSGRATLSLCIIVKNEEENIARCLMSIKPVVDEMIVVDTGSSDKTKDIATAMGAKVSDFPWTDNFADARNRSLELATGDWILVLDADEVISLRDHTLLLNLINSKSSRGAAYNFETRNYTDKLNVERWQANDGTYGSEEAGIGWHPSVKVRLFPNDSRFRFSNPIHECVEPSILLAGLELKPSPVPVHHYGGLISPEKVLAKKKAYYELGKKKLADDGRNSKAIFELARAAGEIEKYDEAITLWEDFVSLDQNVPLAYVHMASTYLLLRRYQDALRTSEKALALAPHLKEAVVAYASCVIIAGDPKDAVPLVSKILETEPSYMLGIAVLAVASCISGQRAKGLGLFAKLSEMRCDMSAYFIGQAETLIAVERIKEARSLLDAMLQAGLSSAEASGLLSKF
ncbi:MAG: hypothetical protein C0402_10010 [Thermodesulfovibrio sp.]|nr:hypothetical protein [Thermodesulfovibrio sp.]